MESLMAELGANGLTSSQRLQLALELLDSLPESEEFTLTNPQRQELSRRLALLESDPTLVSPWHEVEARVMARLKNR
jgi:putative addiction module component (TIGR02574 family)